MNKEKPTLKERVIAYMKLEEALLKEHGLQKNLTVDFPLRKRVPFLSRIALIVLKQQGGILDTFFKEKK